ncbi:hypothetical protein N7536_006150 [Penicillium majusculum]|nr:hypothetical protein N7536_006150 [Penicillium majusculum]
MCVSVPAVGPSTFPLLFLDPNVIDQNCYPVWHILATAPSTREALFAMVVPYDSRYRYQAFTGA